MQMQFLNENVMPEGISEVSRDIKQLVDELAELKVKVAVLREREARIMELVRSKDAAHLLHDIRNILNERELLRALADLSQ